MRRKRELCLIIRRIYDIFKLLYAMRAKQKYKGLIQMIQDWSREAADHTYVAWLMRHIGKVHRQASRSKMTFGSGKEPGQPIILMVLQEAAQENRAVSQNDLAQVLHVSDPTITASLKSLERQGYVAREPDPADMRRKLPVLTPLGEEVAMQSRKCVEQVSEVMLGGFTETEKEQLVAYLQRMQQNVEQLIG